MTFTIFGSSIRCRVCGVSPNWELLEQHLKALGPGYYTVAGRKSGHSTISFAQLRHYSFQQSLTAFFNSCAVRKSFFDFAAKERARRYIVEEPREASRTQRRQCGHFDYLLLKMI